MKPHHPPVDSTYTNKSAYKDTTNKKYYKFSGWNKSGEFNITSNTSISGSWDNGTSVPTMIDLNSLTVSSTFKFGKYQVESEIPWDIEWEIVHQTDDYQIAMTKQIIDLRCFDAAEPTNPDNNNVNTRKGSGNNNWKVSNIKQFLNSDQANWYSNQHQYDAPPNNSNTFSNPYDNHKGFLYYFSDKEKALLQDMTFTLANPDIDGGGSYIWTGKVWLPTYTQMSGTQNNRVSEGIKFDKYTDNNSRIKTINKYCAENNKHCKAEKMTEGTSNDYWMSSIYPVDSCHSRVVDSDGSSNGGAGYAYTDAIGLAPCIRLPRTGGGVPSDLNYID